MTGRTFKRGATWTFVVDVGRDADGRRRQRKRGGYATKREAERALREVLATVDGLRYIAPSRLTVARFLRDDWLPATRPPKVSPSTWDGHLRRVERYIVPAVGGLRLQALNPAHLNTLYARLRAGGRADGGQLSPRTVQLVHITIRKALGDAVRWGLVARNVAILADRPATGSRSTVKMTTWSPGELRAFLEHVAGDRLEASWVTVASTGMRRGEVLGLRWADVDLDEARLAVRSTRILVAGHVETSEPKTRGSGAPSTSTSAPSRPCVRGVPGRRGRGCVGAPRGPTPGWCSPGRTVPGSTRDGGPNGSSPRRRPPGCRGSASTTSGTATRA